MTISHSNSLLDKEKFDYPYFPPKVNKEFLELAEKYGLTVSIRCGKAYAICPICNDLGWESIEDALSCCPSVGGSPSKLIKELELEEKKEESLRRMSDFYTPKNKYGVVIKNKTKFESWRRIFGIRPTNATYLEKLEDVDNLSKEHRIVFVGKKKDYENKEIMEHPRIQEELQIQESFIDYPSYKLEGEYLVPLDSKESGAFGKRMIIDGKVVFAKIE